MPKSRNIKDPFAGREAQNYDQPIPSREFLLGFLAEIGVPLDHAALCRELNLKSEQDQEALRRRLIAMSRDGQLISNRVGMYGLADRMELIKGRIQGNRDGSGYFIPADGSQDLHLKSDEMRKVFDGDIVLARVADLDRRGRPEGMIVEILQRANTQIVGRFYDDAGIGILVPANRRIAQEILVPHKESRGATDGQYVVGEIVSFPTAKRKSVANIIEILGDTATPGLEIAVAVRSYGLPHEWPAAVKNQAQRIETRIADDECSRRRDLRELPFVTIDGEDAKDFDDAVFAEPGPDQGWRLFVAIADVSHYVHAGSELDTEAVSRGNSVYFPGHVIPMLPETLSNGVCSLKPNEDRLVLVCEMQVDSEGVVKDYNFSEAVIHSHARLTYTEVADMLEPTDAELSRNLQARLRKRHESLIGTIESLYALYLKLRQARERGGALDFDTTETRIIFGEDRKIREIVPVVRNCAHRLIEECMLCANVSAAKLLRDSKLPVLYRVHEGPSAEKLEKLRQYLGEMGLTLGGGEKPTPMHYQRLLKKVEPRPDAHLLHSMVIRSMMQAVYQEENNGHFGLGFEAYTHFTSPIRRYPDLLVHRAIRMLLRSNKNDRHLLKNPRAGTLERNQGYPYNRQGVMELGGQCSMTERRADSASYDVIDWLKCEYMLDRVGDEFDGTVASVTGFGLFVELDGVYVEGLVHITALDNDYYHFDAISHVLTGERTGKRYRMGDSVRVQIAAVNLDERKIDLAMVGARTSRGQAGRGEGRRKPGSNSGGKQRNAAPESGGKSDAGAPGRKSSSDKDASKGRRKSKGQGKGQGKGKGKGKDQGKSKGQGKSSAGTGSKPSTNRGTRTRKRR